MTPQERELVAGLFDRLAQLERNPRDPDAEQVMRDGLRRAPNALYPLVQTNLLQDEALRVANDRIAELEDALAQMSAPQGSRREEPRGFLDSMRDTFLGREEDPRAGRGSVPRAGQPMGVPPGFGREPARDPWANERGGPQTGPMGGGPFQGGPMGREMGSPQGGAPAAGGGSFLGTAAAAAAGAIGGGLLMNSIRGMMGGQDSKGPFSGAFDQLAGKSGSGGGSGGGELAKDAGLNDIGQGGRQGFGGQSSQDQHAANAQQDADQDQDDLQDEEEDYADYGDFDDDEA